MVGLLAYFEERTNSCLPEMIDAIHCIRAEGIKTALLTNNWKKAGQREAMLPVDRQLFDVVSIGLMIDHMVAKCLLSI